jgi:hypothetical protein
LPALGVPRSTSTEMAFRCGLWVLKSPIEKPKPTPSRLLNREGSTVGRDVRCVSVSGHGEEGDVRGLVPCLEVLCCTERLRCDVRRLRGAGDFTGMPIRPCGVVIASL